MQLSPPISAAEARTGWPRALALAVLILAAGLALAPWTTLWDRDEPRFAQATVEMLAPLEGHGGNLLLSSSYYLIVILTGFAPWTLYLPGALVATKLPHYVLPVWPALALSPSPAIWRRHGTRGPGCGRIRHPSADDWR